ncbi:MAG: tetratricopeptide repeat protein [Polyangiales bacterium]
MPTADTLDSVDPQALYDTGMEFARFGDHIRAAQYLMLAWDRGYDPNKVVPKLIRMYTKASRFRDAIQTAERRLGQDPLDANLRLVLATLYLSVQEKRKAYAEASAAVRVLPDDPRAHYLMAILEREANTNAEAARTHYARYLELAPAGPHANEARAFVENPPEEPLPTNDGGAPVPVRVPAPAPTVSPDEMLPPESPEHDEATHGSNEVRP